jgi:hydrogenase nickel incorporation protein HypA/HybF
MTSHSAQTHKDHFARVRTPVIAAPSLSARTASALDAFDLALHSHACTPMHELAIMQSVVDAVVDQIGDQQIVRVCLEIGELSGVARDSLRFCFDVCVHETALANATLELATVAGEARCRVCGVEAAMPLLGTPCACGSFDRAITRGDELRLAYVEVL